MQQYNLVDFVGRYQSSEDIGLLNAVGDLVEISISGPWIAGGAVRRLLQQKPLDSDFDLFFSSEEQLSKACASVANAGAIKVLETKHAITYTVTINHQPVKIQLIHFMFYKSAEEVMDSFDFTICQFVYDGTSLFCGDYSLWDLARKRLALHKMTYGVSTLRRLIKYTQQGFTACSGNLASILESVVEDPSLVQREVAYLD